MARIADKINAVTDEQWKQINEFNRKITEEFLEESVQLSPQTLSQYKSGLRIFFWWVKENCDNKSILEVKSRDYLKYQNYLSRRGLSPSAIKFKRAAVSSLNGYIITYYEEDYPMFKNFITKKIANPPKAFVHEKQPLNNEEYKLLLDELEKREKWQMLAYVKFTYATGCRRAESRQLLKDIVNAVPIVKDKEYKNPDGTIEIKQVKFYQTSDIRCKGKGQTGKCRRLQLDEDAMIAIKKWLEVRGEDDCPYVFVTKYGNEVRQISASTFNAWTSGLFSEIVGRRVHPHQFREQRATDLVVNEGKDIRVAQKLLGHESSETTNIYVIRNSDEDIEDAFI